MSENEVNISKFLAKKYLELNGSEIGKYFFLYFLHLSGKLAYHEENGTGIFRTADKEYRAMVPVIDTEEKYREMAWVHRKLERISEKLKDFNDLPASDLNLLEL